MSSRFRPALIAIAGLAAFLAAPPLLAQVGQAARGELLVLKPDAGWTQLRVVLKDGRVTDYSRNDIARVEYRYPGSPAPRATGPYSVGRTTPPATPSWPSSRGASSSASPSPVGTWAWVSGQQLVIKADGTCQVYLNGAQINACTWVRLSDGRYRLTHRNGGWVDTISVSADGGTLTGANNLGYALRGTRTGAAPAPQASPQAALAGRWNWVSGQTLVIAGDGSFKVYLGSQQINDGQWVSLGGNSFRLTHRSGGWIDTITLSADGRTISGVNNRGNPLQGSRQ
jgi:hypothetical protein